MTSFSALLSALVEQKNIQIYPLTQYCSLDRSTMYKYLNGKRLPPSRRWWNGSPTTCACHRLNTKS